MQVVTPPFAGYETPRLSIIGFIPGRIIAASDWNDGSLADDPANWNNPYGDTVL